MAAEIQPTYPTNCAFAQTHDPADEEELTTGKAEEEGQEAKLIPHPEQKALFKRHGNTK